MCLGEQKNISNNILKLTNVYSRNKYAFVNCVNVTISSDYLVYEFNYLIYNKGDHFKKHRDRLDKPPNRIYSTSTLISQSSDFEGGELVYPDFELTVKPEKGMMCIHTAGWENNHGVRPVENGFRHTTVSFGTMDADFIVENQGSMLNVYR